MIAPLFLLLLGGIIEFGQAFWIQHSLSAAARHGARAAVLDEATNAAVIQKVKNHCAKALGIPQDDVSVTIAVNGFDDGNLLEAEKGDEICVTVTVSFTKVGVSFFVHMLTSSTLSAHCTFERE